MPSALNVVEGSYFHDILKQPEALKQTLEALEEAPDLSGFARDLRADRYRRIVLTGMGGSLYALYPLHLRLAGLGLSSLLVETAELIHFLPGLLDRNALVVTVSQSGRSAEIVRVLEMCQGHAPVIGVTNDGNAPLARLASACVVMRAGTEATVSCKTYLASLLTLEWLGAVLTGGDVKQAKQELSLAAPAVAQYLHGLHEHVEGWNATLDGITQIFVTGRGPSISPAETGGLILKESAHFAAEGMSCPAFRHGPFESLGRQVLVVVFEGSGKTQALNRALAEDVRNAGGTAALVGTGAEAGHLRIPACPDSVRPMLEMLPVQMLSLALAARSGREAGKFELATKVTDTE